MLSGGLLLLIVVTILILSFTADRLSQYIPFSVEKSLAERVNTDAIETTHGVIENYLQTLANEISADMDLPPGMHIAVSVIDSNMVNAFATLGGNVTFFTGLLDAIPDENALAMVMAHEIAHVKLRHPLRALGRGVVVGITVATVAGATNNDLVTQLLGNTSLLTGLSFSRDQESAADKLAVAALVKRYGHAHGAAQLFAVLKNQHEDKSSKMPEFFATHPLDEHRTAAVNTLAKQNGWSLQGNKQAIPKAVSEELKHLHELRQKKVKKKPKTTPGI